MSKTVRKALGSCVARIYTLSTAAASKNNVPKVAFQQDDLSAAFFLATHDEILSLSLSLYIYIYALLA
jgi:hypothetical protein